MPTPSSARLPRSHVLRQQRRTRCVRATLGVRLFTRSVVRSHLRRESSLGAVCGHATGARRGAVIRTSAVPAISRRSCRRPLSKVRSRLRAKQSLTSSERAEVFVAVVREPMQKFLLPRLHFMPRQHLTRRCSLYLYLGPASKVEERAGARSAMQQLELLWG